MKLLVIFTLVTIASLSIATTVHAQLQNSVALSVSPPHSEIMIKPGKNIVQAFNIHNTGTLDLIVIPKLVDFTADQETGAQRILSTSSFPYAELQNLDKKLNQPFTLQAGQKDQLVLKLTIPEDADDQDYYQTLLLDTKPAQQLEASGATSQALANIGINLLIRVSASGTDRGQIVIDRVQIPQIIDMFSPINMKIFAKNTGNNYTKVEGEVKIISAITKNVDKVFPILEENVLAGGIRQIHTATADPDDAKSATAGELHYDPLFLLGPYTVEITLKKENMEPHSYFGRVWALPISPLIVLVLFFTIRRFLKKLSNTTEISRLTP